MKENPTPTLYIKHKGFFDLSKLMKNVRSWLTSHNYEFQEGTYKYKTSQIGIEMEWKVTGTVKINEYVKHKIECWVRTWDMRDVEVVSEGEKKNMTTGRIAVEVSSVYTLDYQKRFKGSKFLQGLEEFYHRYIIKHTIEEKWEDFIYMRVNQLAKLIRETFAHEVV
jgi:hypothetical protein